MFRWSCLLWIGSAAAEGPTYEEGTAALETLVEEAGFEPVTRDADFELGPRDPRFEPGQEAAPRETATPGAAVHQPAPPGLGAEPESHPHGEGVPDESLLDVISGRPFLLVLEGIGTNPEQPPVARVDETALPLEPREEGGWGGIAEAYPSKGVLIVRAEGTTTSWPIDLGEGGEPRTVILSIGEPTRLEVRAGRKVLSTETLESVVASGLWPVLSSPPTPGTADRYGLGTSGWIAIAVGALIALLLGWKLLLRRR